MDFPKLKKLLNKPQKIVITTHRGPDGDAMGSSLALLNILEQLNHLTTVITPNDYADFLKWMPGSNNVLIYEENEVEAQNITNNADLIFMLDFSNLDRIANYSESLKKSNAIKILIDHHQDPDISIANIIFSDIKACSTAQIVYELIMLMDFKDLINKEIAECLYTGIMTDTGSFKYSNTNAKTHNIISELISAGANNSKIHDLIYDNSSANRMKLLGYCLNEKLLLYTNNNSAIISLSEDELERFNYKKGDTEGFVNYALAINKIKFAAFIVEKDGIVKLSLRSKGNVKVNEIAGEYFNGGGHTNASGGVSQVSINETIKILENIIKTNKQLIN